MIEKENIREHLLKVKSGELSKHKTNCEFCKENIILIPLSNLNKIEKVLEARVIILE